jgi:hypothetical protein
LTQDRTVIDLYAAHIASQATSDKGLWRAAFVNLAGRSTVAQVDDTLSSDTSVVLATLADDPDASGTQYTYLRVTSGNAELMTLGVRAGDIVRYLFTTDGFGGEEYTEFVIDEVVNEMTLRLASGHSVGISTPQKVEIWRNLSHTEMATDLGTRAESLGSNRVCCVWPDTLGDGDLSVAGYFLCAALAGLRSGVAPHQSLTNVEIVGFDDVSRTVDIFNDTNLTSLADAGVWAVTQDLDGVVTTRLAKTTDISDFNSDEMTVPTTRLSLETFPKSRIRFAFSIDSGFAGQKDAR